MTLKCAKNAFAAGLRRGPRCGSSRRSTRRPSRLGKGIPLPTPTPLYACASTLAPSALVTRRLRRLEPRTFGARQSATPHCFLTNRTLHCNQSFVSFHVATLTEFSKQDMCSHKHITNFSLTVRPYNGNLYVQMLRNKKNKLTTVISIA